MRINKHRPYFLVDSLLLMDICHNAISDLWPLLGIVLPLLQQILITVFPHIVSTPKIQFIE